MADPQSLKKYAERGQHAVFKGGYDYKSILEKLLHQMKIGE